jgi:hypothetical protein
MYKRNNKLLHFLIQRYKTRKKIQKKNGLLPGMTTHGESNISIDGYTILKITITVIILFHLNHQTGLRLFSFKLRKLGQKG